MDTLIIEKIQKEIEKFEPTTDLEKVGRVVRVGDGVAEIEGLENAVMSEMVLFDDSGDKSLEEAMSSKEALYGLVLNLEEDAVKAVVLGDVERVQEGMLVKSTGRVLSIPVGESLLGRVVNTLAEPLDGKGPIESDSYAPIERDAYGVIDRKSVDTPIHTGIKAIDAMVPIGRGQRELIIGDRFTGKTTVAIDAILNQKNEPEDTRPICIYVAVGQKESKTARIVAQLEEAGAMDYTVVVSASAAAPAALQFLAPFSGATIGEYFMDRGRDALVIYDDLSKQAVAYRQLSLLLRRPPGREAYPGDIFYLHSRLLERAAKLSDEKGGGSLTALPIIETQEGDVSSYIPTNVISITDGQIFLDAGLFNKGTRPAIDVGNSVSRVGSSAQTKAMKAVGGSIRIELAQFRELEAFMQFAQDLDEATKKRIDSGRRMAELLKQRNGEPLPFEKQVVSIYAGINGLFAGIKVEDVTTAEGKWLEYIDGQHSDVLKEIHSTGKLEDATTEKIDSAMEDFKKTHTDLFSTDEE
ncbi:F0F1 ATP synthase subunit alpha [bacterium]|nr:F0F1 ATP synthase subunit alpha [bacterium]|tara:strand:- start:43555 stop:45129 length:1575 start_codon:yes stop_codon:yes gene_type:complete